MPIRRHKSNSQHISHSGGGRSALVRVLFERGLHPDRLGEIPHLSYADARAIRDAGYTALANQRVWRCPPLPDELVFGTMWDHLSDARDRAYGYRIDLAEWHPYRSHPWGDPNAGRFGQTSAAHGSSPYCPRCGYGKVQPATNPRAYV
jgi:hypothetical protein